MEAFKTEINENEMNEYELIERRIQGLLNCQTLCI
jgi:hypothetical protein